MPSVKVNRIVPTWARFAPVIGVKGCALNAGPLTRYRSPRYDPSDCGNPADITSHRLLPARS